MAEETPSIKAGVVPENRVWGGRVDKADYKGPRTKGSRENSRSLLLLLLTANAASGIMTDALCASNRDGGPFPGTSSGAATSKKVSKEAVSADDLHLIRECIEGDTASF